MCLAHIFFFSSFPVSSALAAPAVETRPGEDPLLHPQLLNLLYHSDEVIN